MEPIEIVKMGFGVLDYISPKIIIYNWELYYYVNLNGTYRDIEDGISCFGLYIPKNYCL
jgi:hypothetical protein